jgi:hypothetical protein
MRRDLVGPRFPPGARYIYDWFLAISSARQGSGFGPLALASSEIAAWCSLSGHHLTPWEFDTIRKLDQAWRSIYAELHKPDPPSNKPGQGAGHGP